MLPWFTKYPNQNDEILNLDCVIKQVENLKAAYEAFLAANSLTFADPILWDITKQYSKNTIVLSSEGDAYLSKKVVGKGIQLNNTDYWLEIFNFAEYVRTANSNLTMHIEQNTTRASAAYAVDDWLLWEDVLYKVTAAIDADDLLTVGTNIVHFTVEDFCRTWQTYMVNTIAQYKNDIDASELLYKQQLDQTVLQYKNDIDASELAYKNQLDASVSATTDSLQTQLNTAIAGATVDSEVINARVGYDGTGYATLRESITTQIEYVLNTLNVKTNYSPLKTIGLRETGVIAYTGSTSSAGQHIKIPVSQGDKYLVTGHDFGTSNGVPLYLFLASDNSIVSYWYHGANEAKIENKLVTIPSGVAYLVVNGYTSNGGVLPEIKALPTNSIDLSLIARNNAIEIPKTQYVNTLYNGVTFSLNDDGTIHVQGTSTASGSKNIYIYSNYPSNLKAGDNIMVMFRCTDNPYMEAQLFTTDDGSNYDQRKIMPYVTTADNVMFYKLPSSSVGFLVRLTFVSGVTMNCDIDLRVIKLNYPDVNITSQIAYDLKELDLNALSDDNSIYLLTDSYTYTNAPSGIVAGFLLNLLSGRWRLQMIVDFNNTDIIYTRRGNFSKSTWSDWKKIKGSGVEQIFNSYEVTNNISASPTIDTSTEQYLAATGDNTDVTSDILTLLQSTGVCRLGPGDFYVNNLIMPVNSSIIGSGSKSRIILKSSGDGFAVQMNTNCTISKCSIMGSLTDIVKSSTLSNRHGILWAGNYTDTEDASLQPSRGIVSDVFISGFTGGGITLYDTGYGDNNNLIVENAYIYNCNAGINISYWSEFNKFVNCHCTHNYYGVINNGGNNMFSNCDFSVNTLCCLMDNSSNQSPNNTHGSMVGCVFNHANNNTGYGIVILNCTPGFIFDGCQIFYSKINLENSAGIVVSNSNFGSTNCDISIDGGGAILFVNNMHGSQPTITINDNTNVHFTNSYVRSTGAAIVAS